MDLATLAAADQASFAPIYPATRKPIPGTDGQPWTWTLAGPSHERAIAARDATRVRQLKRARKGEEAEPDEIEREVVETVALRVLGWTPIGMKGADFPCTRQNVVQLFTDPAFGWLYMAVTRRMVEDDAFLSVPSAA